MKSLLEKAKEFKPGRTKCNQPTDGEILLAIAWLKDELRFSQICYALDIPTEHGGNLLYRIAVWLKEAYKRGDLKVKI